MSFKVLYSELQPCLLISCGCTLHEPFLLMIRSMNQVVRCERCNASYSIEVATYVAEDSAAAERMGNGFRIKCTPGEKFETQQHVAH